MKKLIGFLAIMGLLGVVLLSGCMVQTMPQQEVKSQQEKNPYTY